MGRWSWCLVHACGIGDSAGDCGDCGGVCGGSDGDDTFIFGNGKRSRGCKGSENLK